MIVNGNPEMHGRSTTGAALPAGAGTRYDLIARSRRAAAIDSASSVRSASSRGMRQERRVLFTDTTMRDAQHRSWLRACVRMTSWPWRRPTPAWRRSSSPSNAGAALRSTSMLRFLRRIPGSGWRELREAVPNILLQMMVRASNAVGYTSYPDNVVQHFITQAATRGIDLFRVFDLLKGVDNMRVAIDAVRESGGLVRGGDVLHGRYLFDAARPKWNLRYYVDLARQLKGRAPRSSASRTWRGCAAARRARAGRRTAAARSACPFTFDTHDTSGIAAASVLAAIDAGADAVYGALDAMSGLTAQPNLSAMAVGAGRHRARPRPRPRDTLQALSHYWEVVRRYYAPFEADMRAGTAGVYRHEMPGPQYTNLRAQARGMGLEHRWDEICQRYAEVNLLFGDLVKITPTSTAVADMALSMVANGLSRDDVLDPARDIASRNRSSRCSAARSAHRPRAFRRTCSAKCSRASRRSRTAPPRICRRPIWRRARHDLEATLHRPVSERELSSWLLFPALFLEFARHRDRFGDVSVLPTTAFLYGLRQGEEIEVEAAPESGT